MSVCLSSVAVIETSPVDALSPFDVSTSMPPGGSTGLSSSSSDRFVPREPPDVDGRAELGHWSANAYGMVKECRQQSSKHFTVHSHAELFNQLHCSINSYLFNRLKINPLIVFCKSS